MQTTTQTSLHPDLPPTMHAVRLHQFGGPEVIEVERVPIPQPGDGEVLVRVRAAGIGPWDGWIRSGKSALPQPLPLTLGSELCGEVVRVGAKTSAFKVGDVVFGVTNKQFTNAHAEYAIALADMIALKPAYLDDMIAASLPVIAVTAWQALFDHARLRSGDKVLIHGGAGSVGAYAVQFAKRAGIHVITTVSSKDVSHALSLGADQVIDYQQKAFDVELRDVDAVIDLVGGDTQQRSFAVLKPGGILVSAVSPPDQVNAAGANVRAMFFLVDVGSEVLTKVVSEVLAGNLAHKLGPVFHIDQMESAHDVLEGLRPNPGGKMLMVPSVAIN